MSTKPNGAEFLARLSEIERARRDAISLSHEEGSAKALRKAHAAERRALRAAMSALGLKRPRHSATSR